MDSPPLHSPMDPPMKPPYRGKRGERRRHAIGEGEGSKRKRGRPGGWRGTLPANDIGGIHNALPSPQHGLSEPPPHGVPFTGKRCRCCEMVCDRAWRNDLRGTTRRERARVRVATR